jgi:hypothetical protein
MVVWIGVERLDVGRREAEMKRKRSDFGFGDWRLDVGGFFFVWNLMLKARGCRVGRMKAVLESNLHRWQKGGFFGHCKDYYQKHEFSLGGRNRGGRKAGS